MFTFSPTTDTISACAVAWQKKRVKPKKSACAEYEKYFIEYAKKFPIGEVENDKSDGIIRKKFFLRGFLLTPEHQKSFLQSGYILKTTSYTDATLKKSSNASRRKGRKNSLAFQAD